MKHLSNIRHYYNVNGFPSSCEIDFWCDADGVVYALFTDVNDGTSVTNASEAIANDVAEMLLRAKPGFPLRPDKVRFFETYPYVEQDSVDEITYSLDNGKLINPQWSPCNNFWKMINDKEDEQI